MEMFLRKLSVSEDVTRRLTKLPLLYGPLSKIDKARSMTSNPTCVRALDNLEKVIEILRMYGCADDLTIDLGMALEAGYYSGTVFRAQTAHVGQPILSGGRYDGLIKSMGGPMTPAVGWAMGVERVIASRGELPVQPEKSVYMVSLGPSCNETAFNLMQALRAAGDDGHFSAQIDLKR